MYVGLSQLVYVCPPSLVPMQVHQQAPFPQLVLVPLGRCYQQGELGWCKSISGHGESYQEGGTRGGWASQLACTPVEEGWGSDSTLIQVMRLACRHISKQAHWEGYHLPQGKGTKLPLPQGGSRGHLTCCGYCTGPPALPSCHSQDQAPGEASAQRNGKCCSCCRGLSGCTAASRLQDTSASGPVAIIIPATPPILQLLAILQP